MKKLVLFDMDGTVYLGNKLIDGALETFKYIKDNNINFVFITNNSSHDISFYEEKVNNMGIACNRDNFYSSIETTIATLKKEGIKEINVLGNKCLIDALSKDFKLVEEFDKNKKVEAIVVGFTTELRYENLMVTALYLQNGCDKYYATNVDYRCPIEDGYYIPDCGGLVEMLYLCTGKRPKFLGKPEPDMINCLIDKFKVNKEDVLVVGDRIYTDIKSGINAGVDTCAVLSGEIDMNDIEKSGDKPTYVIDSIKDLRKVLEGKAEIYY